MGEKNSLFCIYSEIFFHISHLLSIGLYFLFRYKIVADKIKNKSIFEVF